MMSKLVIGIIFLSALVLGGTVFYVMKNHSYFDSQVTAQLRDRFYAYANSNFAKLDVGSTSAHDKTYSYYVSFKKPWNFEVRNKKVLVTPPDIESDPPEGAAFKESVREEAKTKIQGYVKAWLQSEFPNEKEKDLQVEVVF